METNMHPTLTISVKNFGDIIIELYPESAPNTVANFVDYVDKGLFSNLIFHRIIKGFMIQGGGTDEKLAPIKGEFKSNGFENTLKHVPGVISMARTSDPNSATSQFFIMHDAAPHLDGQYAAFGMAVKGIDVVNRIAAARTDQFDKPLDDVIIESITIEKNGYQLPDVERL